MSYQKIKFCNPDQTKFFPSLRSRVEEHFTANKIVKTGGNAMLIKASFMLALYLIPYGLILSGMLSGAAMLAMAFCMGLGVAGVGMSVMHDALHGSMSTSKTLNKLFGASIYLLGGNAYNWEVQHNRLHHTYTNIHDVDEDITGKTLLRLSYGDKRKYYHKFQYIYAFFLYSLMTISFLWKDFKEINLFNRMSDSGLVKPFPRKEIIRLMASKIGYVIFIAVIPLVFTSMSFGTWLAGFMVMHLTAGMILSTVFQMAHVVEGAEQPEPDSHGCIETAWAVHQILTTSNFAGRNRVLSWYIGGLDYQIEHHLFPNISHIHYRELSPIVRQTATEFGFTYNAKSDFRHALGSHVRMLKRLGRVCEAPATEWSILPQSGIPVPHFQRIN